jgi:hypothetical protein
MPHEEEQAGTRPTLLRGRPTVSALFLLLLLAFILPPGVSWRVLGLFRLPVALLLLHAILQRLDLLREHKHQLSFLLFGFLLRLHWQLLGEVLQVVPREGVQALLVPAHEAELDWRSGAHSRRMVDDCCVLCVLLAGVEGEGGEEGGHGLELGEVVVDFAVAEEVVEQQQQFAQENALLVAVALPRSLLREPIH